jgi:antitoxin ParD1/3/4
MNISLPDSLKFIVDEQVSQTGRGNSGEYVCELICKDADRRHLRGLLLDGADSSPATPVDAGYFAAMRERVQQQTLR